MKFKLASGPLSCQPHKGDVGHAAPHIMKRNFDTSAADQKWVTDVTEFNVAGNKLYLSPVMDLFNGEIIAFETSSRPQFALVGSMLRKALKLQSGERPILHSDQGWQVLCRRLPTHSRSLRHHLFDDRWLRLLPKRIG